MSDLGLGLALLQLVWVNILLSGDNAMVIALACRSLPQRQRRLGIVLGAGAAVLLRIVFTAGIAQILEVPYLKVIGGVLLFWVAIRLLLPEDEDGKAIPGSDNLWRAIRTVVVADAVMSLDNVLAIAAAAKGSMLLIMLGLALSVPLVVAGSTLIVAMIDRFPLLVWAGSAFLGWIAGEMLMSDRAVLQWTHHDQFLAVAVAAAGALLVLAAGGWLRQRGRDLSCR